MTCDKCNHQRTSRRCDECARRRAATWYAANRKRAAETRHKYYERNKDTAKARARVHAKANRERINATNVLRRLADPERYRQYSRDHHRRHPEATIETTNVRRARKAKAFVEKVDRWHVYVRDRRRCHLCGDVVNYYEMHMDHVIPLCKGGEHSYANCKVACAGCNLRKGGR